MKKDFNEVKKYLFIGFIGAFIDFIFEYLGTGTGHWNYNESLYFIFNMIPVELILLFFSGSIVAMFIFTNLNKIRIPIKSNVILYILFLITALIYIREMYFESFVDVIPLSIVVGLWGISNISKKNRPGALLIAIFAVFLDLFVETTIIGSGSYSYKNVFTISIPISYGLFVLGILAAVEKVRKYDSLSKLFKLRK